MIITLSEREQQVLDLIAEGMTNAAIGHRLGLSEHTVKSRMRTLLRHLAASDRAHAVAIGYQRGLLGGLDATRNAQLDRARQVFERERARLLDALSAALVENAALRRDARLAGQEQAA
jgi:DNA-binding CsgD family transcriptional regulator